MVLECFCLRAWPSLHGGDAQERFLGACNTGVLRDEQELTGLWGQRRALRQKRTASPRPVHESLIQLVYDLISKMTIFFLESHLVSSKERLESHFPAS